ncbi:MAG: hypothetical protein K9J26_04520 [Limnohabitans sp.]|jgi:hypothetical protein|nr:hypothetical protein [Limnohabitans sp.]
MTNNDAALVVQCSKWQEIEVKQINPETTKPKTRMKVTNQGERNMMTNEQVMMEVDQLLEEEHRRLMHEINKQEFYSGVLAHQQAVTKIYDRFEEEVKAQETLDEHKAYLRVIEHSQWLRERNDHLEDLLQAYREKLIEEARLDARETIFAPCN